MNIGKAIFAMAAISYFIIPMLHPDVWHFIDGVNLMFHEAGHPLMRIFGEFISMIGGSLFQVLIPAICAVYFSMMGQGYSAALVLLWLGQNFANISVYAGDAIMMQIPLLGGDAVVHDWNYLLSSMGILRYAPLVSHVMYAIGWGIFLLGAFLSLWFSRKQVSIQTTCA